MNMIKSLLLGLVILFTTTLQAHSISDQTLVTIHGFLGSPWHMVAMTKGYESEGVKVIHWKYPGKYRQIAFHAAELVKSLNDLAEKSPGTPINFISYSMGGLILRAALSHPECPSEAKIGRAVLLAPPNQASGWDRFLELMAAGHKQSVEQMRAQLQGSAPFESLGSFPDSLAVLVIAGDKSSNLRISDANDGLLTVEETYLDTPSHHEVVSEGHTSILSSFWVYQIAKAFFKRDF